MAKSDYYKKKIEEQKKQQAIWDAETKARNKEAEEINAAISARNNPQTSAVPVMTPAEEAKIDKDIELAKMQQALGGLGQDKTVVDDTAKFGTAPTYVQPGLNPEFAQRAMAHANANGDTRVTPETLQGTPSIMDRMSQWGDDVWDSFFDDEIGDASVAQAKQEINPIAEGDIGNQEYKGPADEGLGTVSIYGPLKGAKVAGSFIKSAFTAGKNAYKNRPKPQPIVEKHVNPTPLLPAPKPVVVPRIGNNMPSTVVKQSINTGKNVVPRNMNRWGEPMQRYAPKPKIGPGVPTIAAVTNQQEPPMGPTIDITYKPDDVVPVVPPVDMPQNGGPDRGGYPNKARLPNNANAAPQRPGYKVVKSGDGSPVKAGGGGYMWSKDYQHPIWSQEGIWKQGGNG